MSPSPVKLWILPQAWGLPNASPFVWKLMSWMRMAGIDYEAHPITGAPKSSNGKAPYIELDDGSYLSDSSVIMAHLTTTHDVNLDAWMSDLDRAQAVLIQRLFEDHMYWLILYERWVDDAGWAVTKPAYFKAHMPFFVYWIVPTMLRRQVRRSCWGQGFGRMSAQERRDRTARDMQTLSALLGDKEFLLSQQSSVDAIADGFLGNIWRAPVPGAAKDALGTHKNLVDYVERMTARYWANGSQ